MNATGSCAECKFFLHMGEYTKLEGLGECHRFPPKSDALLVDMKEVEVKLPDGKVVKQHKPDFAIIVVPTRTPLMGWCGEYVPALKIPTAAEHRDLIGGSGGKK